MTKRIHILGASGSGTTTLALKISSIYNYTHFDTDDFFWVKTDPPFTKHTNIEERVRDLSAALNSVDQWVLSGSLCGWGDRFIPFFDLVIFLWIPEEVRMKRLEMRERQRYGEKILSGGEMYQSHLEFMEWASQYDAGDMNIRSKQLHYTWLKQLPCKVLKIEGDLDIEEKLKRVKEVLLYEDISDIGTSIS